MDVRFLLTQFRSCSTSEYKVCLNLMVDNFEVNFPYCFELYGSITCSQCQMQKYYIRQSLKENVECLPLMAYKIFSG